MHLRILLAASVASLPLACALATPAFAQETTSSITGQVTNAGTVPVAGARVTVTHVPSGTVINTQTDATGTFTLRGLRVGGPYDVAVAGAGFPDQTITGIQLLVGDTFSLPIQLGGTEIVVTGTRAGSGRDLATGSQTGFNAEQIANTVSARRDIRDILRKDLLSTYNANVGGVSIAGGNIRTQRFSVDGVQLQDSFGLNYGGLPSTRGIVSLEAIEQLTVKAAPFDVSEGNFQGGAVNVVLKSGTNTFHGSLFGNFGGPKLTGDFTRDTRDPLGVNFPVGRSRILRFRNYGGSISGPLIKDKLFLSLAYEHLEEGTPNPYGLQASDASTLVPNAFRVDQATYRGLNSVLSTFKSAYGDFAVGDVPTVLNETDKKYSAKVDWNITDGQRFSASYIYHQNSLPNFGAAGSNNTATPYIAVQSGLYALTELTKAASAQLNSQWTDKLSTELRGSYKYYRRGQDAFSGTDFAQFNVCADNNSSPLTSAINAAETQCSTGIPIFRLGPDTPRQANQFNNKILTFQGSATYHAGEHTFRLEYDNAYSKLYNLFVFGTNSTNSTTVGTGGPQGLYYFDSFTDYSARQANELVLNSTTTGNKNDGFVRWGYTTHTVGGQDTWRIASTLTINAGVRYDFLRADQTISRNANFVNRFGALYPGLSNTATLDGRDKVQPRFGFNWRPVSSLRISGGVGLFEGGLSDVFISNNYSNSGAALNATGAVITGIDLVRLAGGNCIERVTGASTLNGTLSPTICSALSNINGATPNANALAYLQSNTAVLANATTNSLDPRFRLPAQWKYDVNATWRPEFGDSLLAKGWTLRADALISKAQAAIRWIDLRAQPLVAGGVTQVAPDGRPRYGGSITRMDGVTVQPGSNQDIQLTNTNKGLAEVFAVGLEKTLDFVDLSAGYTYQKVKDVAGTLVSSTVGSSYGVVTSDPNSGGDYGRSVFEVRNTYRLEADFHHKFFGDSETRFGVTWNLRSGVPWSATMFDNTNSAISGRANVFGTTNTSAHLLFVPDFSQATVTNVTYFVNGSATPTTGGVQVGNVIFDSQGTLTALQGLVAGTKLAKYQGGIVPKNALTGPKYSKIDLNFAQDIQFVHGSRFTLLASVENFLNILDRKLGSYQEFGNTAVVRVSCARTTAIAGAQACPLYQYNTFSDPKTTPGTNGIKASLYAIRLGARFSF